MLMSPSSRNLVKLRLIVSFVRHHEIH